VTTVRIGGPELTPGHLAARVVRVEADIGPFGPRLTWRFEADGPEGPLMLRTWTSQHVGPQSRAYAHLRAVLGRAPKHGETVDLDALSDRPCTLEISINADGYAVVESVRPPEKEIPF
jgi:hypothetical protein